MWTRGLLNGSRPAWQSGRSSRHSSSPASPVLTASPSLPATCRNSPASPASRSKTGRAIKLTTLRRPRQVSERAKCHVHLCLFTTNCSRGSNQKPRPKILMRAAPNCAFISHEFSRPRNRNRAQPIGPAHRAPAGAAGARRARTGEPWPACASSCPGRQQASGMDPAFGPSARFRGHRPARPLKKSRRREFEWEKDRLPLLHPLQICSVMAVRLSSTQSPCRSSESNCGQWLWNSRTSSLLGMFPVVINNSFAGSPPAAENCPQGRCPSSPPHDPPHRPAR